MHDSATIHSKFDCKFSRLVIIRIMIINAVKCNLMELTTKSVCVPLRVCRIVMHTCQCICLCQRSFMPSGAL